MEFKKLLEQIAKNGYINYAETDTEMLVMELDRVSSLLDDFKYHNHNIDGKADQGWFMLRNLLMETATRLENS